jgi:membrane protein DedA with SNARE-associated domain
MPCSGRAACLILAIAALHAGWLFSPVRTLAQEAAEAAPAVQPAGPAAAPQEPAADTLRSGRVARLIERFTYAAIIGVLLLCGMGLPLPEEAPILTSAVLAHAGHLDPWWALGACLFGVMLGDSVMFFLGRRWGTHVLDHRLPRRLLTVEHRERIAAYFQRYGAWIIFAARFLPGIRAPLFLTAGTMRVPFWLFFLMNGMAALLSIPLSFWLAYVFTDKLQEVLHQRDTVQYWALGVIAVGVVVSWLVHRAIVRRRSQTAGSSEPPSATSGKPMADKVVARR